MTTRLTNYKLWARRYIIHTCHIHLFVSKQKYCIVREILMIFLPYDNCISKNIWFVLRKRWILRQKRSQKWLQRTSLMQKRSDAFWETLYCCSNWKNGIHVYLCLYMYTFIHIYSDTSTNRWNALRHFRTSLRFSSRKRKRLSNKVSFGKSRINRWFIPEQFSILTINVDHFHFKLVANSHKLYKTRPKNLVSLYINDLAKLSIELLNARQRKER